MNLQQAKELEKYIAEHSPTGVTFGSAVTETVPKMNKTGNPFFGKVRKVSHKVIGLSYDYESRVNSQLTREGKEAAFVAEKPSGMHHVSKMILESDKTPGKYYLQMHAVANNVPETAYLDENDNLVPAEEIKPFLPGAGKASNQGTDKEIVVYSTALENIKSVKVGDFRIG